MINIKVIVDADACPSIKLIENLVKSYNLEMILVSDNSHNLNSDYSKIITVDKQFGSADIKIANITSINDIVITQDYSLALLILSKNAHAINPIGFIYNNDNIDRLVNIKCINTKLRKLKVHIKGPKKRKKINDEKLLDCIKFIIENNCN